MTNKERTSEAKISPLKSISKIWLVPLVAVFIGAWMVYLHITSQGPLITINFETSEGIEAGKTKIKIKNVEVGMVETVELNENLEGVVITARIQKQDTHLLKQDTQFWVVRPRIGKGGISGLGTLLSGAFIELSPGSSNEENYHFDGLENEPVTPNGTPGLRVTLDSGGYRALEVGDPILFHGIDVGRIEFVYFNTEERTVYYNAFIESPYDRLVTTNTKFWEVNGIEVDLSADGIRIESGTLETLISGGVTFDVPNDMPRGEVVTKREYFTVFPNKDAIYENRYTHGLRYILLFKDSIRGLKPGAPVEYRGIKIGSVVRTDVDYDEIVNVLDRNTLVPIMITIEPGRMGFDDDESALPQVKQEVFNLLKQGLRGGLATGNLLTGNKYIELQYDETLTTDLQYFSSYPVIPTLESQFDQIVRKVGKVMDKLYNLPLEPVIISTDEMLKQLTETLKEFKGSANQLELLLKQSTDQELVAGIKSALDNIKRLTLDFAEGSPTHGELQNTLRYMKEALAQLEPLLTQLNQKPNSLIFSEQKNEDIMPEGEK